MFLFHSSRQLVPHAAQESLDGAVGVLRGAQHTVAEEAAAVTRHVRVSKTLKYLDFTLKMGLTLAKFDTQIWKPLFMQPPRNSPPPPSSGYSSAAEFFPMDADSSMNTDDYELYNPRMMAQHPHLRRRQGCQVEFVKVILVRILSKF